MEHRCFIAIDVPVTVKKEIGAILEILEKHDADIKWVAPENIHLTLKFLGPTPDTLLPRITDTVSNILSSYKPFYIRIYTTGVFPSRKYPRVIWTGIDDSEVLRKLKNDIEQSLSLLSFAKEDKEFKPHLTIGRIRSQKGIINVLSELDNYKTKDFGTVHVQEIRLMKSELKPKGAEYTCLSAMALEEHKKQDK
jgi:2'-5' RNA ligase